MKKIILSLTLCLGVAFATMAQDQEAKSYLPVKGDYALGIEATPFLTYVGGFFSAAGAVAPTFDGFNNSIYGKYFIEDNRAIRARLDLNFYGESHKQTVTDDEAVTTTPDATAVDHQKQTVTGATLFVGYEMRRGHGRVQGFYGVEAGLGLTKTNWAYEYGNPMTAANPNPTTHNFGNNIPAAGERATEAKGGLNFGFSAGAFVGVEYFIANQVSLGGELNLGLVASTRGQDETTYEHVVNGEVVTNSFRTRNAGDISNTFGLRTNVQGQVFLMFYF